MDSILTSVKKKLGIQEDYTHFDEDIIMDINSTFLILNQLGVGPEEPFTIEDDVAEWSDFIDNGKIDLVRSYVYLRVRLLFDPPALPLSRRNPRRAHRPHREEQFDQALFRHPRPVRLRPSFEADEPPWDERRHDAPFPYHQRKGSRCDLAHDADRRLPRRKRRRRQGDPHLLGRDPFRPPWLLRLFERGGDRRGQIQRPTPPKEERRGP